MLSTASGTDTKIQEGDAERCGWNKMVAAADWNRGSGT
jgi:hypothetical protein